MGTQQGKANIYRLQFLAFEIDWENNGKTKNPTTLKTDNWVCEMCPRLNTN